MLSKELILIGSYSICVAVIIGLVRLRQIHRAYQPFVLITLAALCHEIISTVLIYYFDYPSNAVTTNILNLVECLLWLIQFKRWNAFERRRWQFPVLIVLLSGIWLVEN